MSLETYLRFAMALGTVLGLILLLAWVARRSGLGGNVVRTAGRKRRLAVVEALVLDPKRRLVIIRRDATEHLILLGPAGELLIERDIPPPEAFALGAAEAAPTSLEEHR